MTLLKLEDLKLGVGNIPKQICWSVVSLDYLASPLGYSKNYTLLHKTSCNV